MRLDQLETTTEESKKRWKNVGPKAYERMIWASIEDYTYKAQFDIAKILFREFTRNCEKDKNYTKTYEAVLSLN